MYEYDVDLNNQRTSYYWQYHFLEGVDNILEIGCSNGFFTRHLAARGAQVVGVEYNPQAAEEASAFCQRVIVGDIETAQVQAQITEKFSAVLLGDVLEHLVDPARLLTLIRQHWLEPEGRVVLSIPNAGHWIFRREVLFGRFPYRERGLFDRTHLRFFTRKTLVQMLRSAGYRVESWAFTANFNTGEDITFTSLAFLFRIPRMRGLVNRLEGLLARRFPNLYAYQFVVCARPLSTSA